jgi:hypothetical protein
MFRRFSHKQNTNLNAEASYVTSERDPPLDCPTHKRFPSQLTENLSETANLHEITAIVLFDVRLQINAVLCCRIRHPWIAPVRSFDVRKSAMCRLVNNVPSVKIKHPPIFSRKATTSCVWLAPPLSRREYPGTKLSVTAPHRVCLVRRVR